MLPIRKFLQQQKAARYLTALSFRRAHSVVFDFFADVRHNYMSILFIMFCSQLAKNLNLSHQEHLLNN